MHLYEILVESSVKSTPFLIYLCSKSIYFIIKKELQLVAFGSRLKVAQTLSIYILLCTIRSEKDKESTLKAHSNNILLRIFRLVYKLRPNFISRITRHAIFQFECCGVNRVAGTTNDFDHTSWCTTHGSCQATASQIPKTCCKGFTEYDYQNAHPDCHSSVSPGYYYDKVTTHIHTQIGQI